MQRIVFQHDLTDAGSFGFASLTGNVLGNSEYRYHLDDSNLVSPYGHTMPPAISDLLDIAAAVMWVDRNHRRPRQQSGNFMEYRGWHRSFELKLGVRNPEIWNDHQIKETLTQILAWLTEDTWIIQFEKQKSARRYSDLQPALFTTPPANAAIILYSGGLDSLAGTVALLQKKSNLNMVLMSAVSDRLSGVVREQVHKLQENFGADRVQHAFMPFHLVHQEKGGEESTQRTRGFLFLSFGIAEAVACNASRVMTCENGLGLLNLPLNRHQLGAQNTRAVHPKTLLLMNSLLTLLGFGHIKCEAPHILETKGDLCAYTKARAVESICHMTVSCDSFPLRIPKPASYPDSQLHCGLCTSCLFRRQSLYAAGLGKEDALTPYLDDVCQPFPTTKASKLELLKFLLDQRQALKQACSSPLPEAALAIEFPELIEACQAIEQDPIIFGLTAEANVMTKLSQLFLRYVDEWQHFPFTLHTI